MSELTPGDTATSETTNSGPKKMIFGLENIPDRKRKDNAMPYQVVTHDIVENTDVCIIGSGAAGAILANKISNGLPGFEGKNVVLIEKGGYYDPEDLNQRESSMMLMLWKNAGLQFNTDFSMLIAQGECLGGSTMINDAVCFDPPAIVRQEWRDKGVGIDEQTWIDAIMEVRDKISVTRLTDAELQKNKNSLILKEACENHSPPLVGANNERNCINCATCGDCHLGCHYQTKQDMANTYIYDAIQSDNPKTFKIYCNCNIKKIKDENGVVTGVQGKFQEVNGVDKFSIRVNAKVFIISAGAIASSALLLSNNIASDKAGIGLAVHPSSLLIAKFKDEVRASEGIPMAYACHEFSVLNYPNNGKKTGGFMLESIFTPIYQFSVQLPWDLKEDLMKDFQKYAMAGIMVRDNSNGTIKISKKGNAQIHYELGEPEIDDLTDGVRVLANLFFDANAEKLIVGYEKGGQITSRSEIDPFVANLKSQLKSKSLKLGMGSAHPQGGNLMGDDPTKCVVDKNCKVYDFKNLFVCDASVFPTSLGVNPQITVMSLATITAEKILKSWDNNFKNFPIKDYFGETCNIVQPMHCNRDTISLMFNQNKNNRDLTTLLNTTNPTASAGWLFDKNSLVITNNSHWRGFVPEFTISDGTPFDDLEHWLTKYLAGFWKKFDNGVGNTLTGKLHIYAMPESDPDIIAEQKDDRIYKNVIQLSYPNLFSQLTLPNFITSTTGEIFDLLKIIDDNTIVGKVFLSLPGNNRMEITPFCMTKKYPIEYMDDDDFDKIFEGHSTPITFRQNCRYLVYKNCYGSYAESSSRRSSFFFNWQ